MVDQRGRTHAAQVSVTSGTWDWDITGDRLYIDDDFARLYGIDSGQAHDGVETRLFFGAIHVQDRPRIRIAVAGILAGAELFSKEYRIVNPAGETIWVHARGQCHLDENDAPVRFTGLLVDVTERKRTEERLRIAQSAGGVGTFEYIDGFATVAVSDEFCRLLGLHPASVLPVETVNSVVDGEARLIPDHRQSGMPASLDAELRILRGDDGERRWIARRGEVIGEGAGFRLVGVIYDITAAKRQERALREWTETLESRVESEVASRQQTEDALRQSQKMEAIGQLTGGIAHDFNNLLMAITSSLGLLEKRLSDEDPQVRRLIENARQGAERGAALTQRMLAFARRQDLETKPVDVTNLVSGLKDLLERTIGPQWSVDLGFPPDLPQVLADPNQLEMALLNLVVNARDAMPDGGVISITAQAHLAAGNPRLDLADGPYVALTVRDRGAGMDEDTLQRAIEPFFTTKGVGKGTGLGLSMIDGLAKQLGGAFELTSVVGEGTNAVLWLPYAQAVVSERQNPPIKHLARAASALKILAVDDDVLILMNTAAMLEDLGHTVLEAGNGAVALELLADNPDIDMLITDQAMPNMTGTELADRVVAIRGDIPVILASGYAEVPPGAHQRIVKLGKPFDQDQLEKAIADAAG